MLRDPVKRILSAYSNLRRDPGNGNHQVATHSTREEILDARSLRELDHGQVRRLAGVQPDGGRTTRSHLKLTIRNVDEGCTPVGFTERFDESFQILRTKPEWPRRGNMPSNVAPKTGRESSTPPDPLALSAGQSAFDLELHAHARRRFDARIAELGPAFQAEVERGRRFNRNWYRQWHRFGVVQFRSAKRKLNSIQRDRGSPKTRSPAA